MQNVLKYIMNYYTTRSLFSTEEKEWEGKLSLSKDGELIDY